MSLFDANGQPNRFQGEAGIIPDGRADDLAAIIRELSRRWAISEKLAADGAGGTATAERPFFRSDRHSVRVTGVRFLPAAALTADVANNATLIVRRRNAQGGAPTVVAQVTTAIAAPGSGNWTAFVDVNLPLAALSQDLLVDVDQMLTFEITKAGGGVVVPAGTLIVYFE